MGLDLFRPSLEKKHPLDEEERSKLQVHPLYLSKLVWLVASNLNFTHWPHPRNFFEFLAQPVLQKSPWKSQDTVT